MNLEPETKNDSQRGQVSFRRKIITLFALALVAVLVPTIFLTTRSHSSSTQIAGGSPYPLSELLAQTKAKPLPTRYHNEATRAISKIPSRRYFVHELDTAGVSLSYDGVSFTNDDIAWEEASCLQASIESATSNAYSLGLDPESAISEIQSSSYCLDQAIALIVFKAAAETAAVSSGHGATMEQAQAYAEQQLAAQETFDASPNAPQLPSGETAQSITLCPSCILGYQQDLDLQYETSALEAANPSVSPNTALLNWFSQLMASSTKLNLSGMPSVTTDNIASFLPFATTPTNS